MTFSTPPCSIPASPGVSYLTSVAIGRGNEIVCYAVEEVAKRIVGKKVEDMFADMGAFWEFRTSGVPLSRILGL